jgi:hypothetical protein
MSCNFQKSSFTFLSMCWLVHAGFCFSYLPVLPHFSTFYLDILNSPFKFQLVVLFFKLLAWPTFRSYLLQQSQLLAVVSIFVCCAVKSLELPPYFSGVLSGNFLVKSTLCILFLYKVLTEATWLYILCNPLSVLIWRFLDVCLVYLILFLHLSLNSSHLFASFSYDSHCLVMFTILNWQLNTSTAKGISLELYDL